jgi:hypothetical protein
LSCLGFDLLMQRPQFPIPYRCLTPGTIGSCTGPIHLKCLANQACDAVTKIGERSAFGLPRKQGSLLQEPIHQDQQDLAFRRKVLIEATHSDACMMSNVLNGGLLIAPLDNMLREVPLERLHKNHMNCNKWAVFLAHFFN